MCTATVEIFLPFMGRVAPRCIGCNWFTRGFTHVAFVNDVDEPSKLVLVDNASCSTSEPLIAPYILDESIEWSTQGDRLSVAFVPKLQTDGTAGDSSIAIISLLPTLSMQTIDGFLNFSWDAGGKAALLVPGANARSRKFVVWQEGRGFRATEQGLADRYQVPKFKVQGEVPMIQTCDFGGGNNCSEWQLLKFAAAQ